MANSAPMNEQMTAALKAQMADIVLPDPVSAWPPAWGWWVLAMVIVIAVISLFVLAMRHRRLNRYRGQALNQLNACNPENLHQQVQHIVRITKASALTVRPALREEVACISASDWGQWLNQQCTKPVFDGASIELIQHYAYQPTQETPSAALHRQTQLWLRTHRFKEVRHA